MKTESALVTPSNSLKSLKNSRKIRFKAHRFRSAVLALVSTSTSALRPSNSTGRVTRSHTHCRHIQSLTIALPHPSHTCHITTPIRRALRCVHHALVRRRTRTTSTSLTSSHDTSFNTCYNCTHRTLHTARRLRHLDLPTLHPPRTAAHRTSPHRTTSHRTTSHHMAFISSHISDRSTVNSSCRWCCSVW